MAGEPPREIYESCLIRNADECAFDLIQALCLSRRAKVKLMAISQRLCRGLILDHCYVKNNGINDSKPFTRVN